MRKELLKGLTEEQIAKIKACESQEEILKLAKEEGIELTDEQLEAVSGGGSCLVQGNDELEEECPKCHSRNYSKLTKIRAKCNVCGNVWDPFFADNK